MNYLDYEKQNKKNNLPKKSWLKSFLTVFLIFVLVGVIVIKATVEAINNLDLNLQEVKQYVEWLNQEVNENELITNPISNADFENFKTKANQSGFNVFENDKVNIEKQDLTLQSDLQLTDKELGAFINKAITTTDNKFLQILTLQIIEDVAYHTLTTVAKLDLKEVKKQILSYNLNFPDYLYITTSSQIVVSDNVIKITHNQVKVNNLDDEKNVKLIKFIDELFKVSNDNTFSQIISLLISEQLEIITQKTQTYLILQDGGILITKQQPEF